MQTQFEKQPIENGQPVFDAPWQAKTFVMAVKLNESGVFTWTEWADELSALKNNDDYYTLWQTTLESLVNKKVR